VSVEFFSNFALNFSLLKNMSAIFAAPVIEVVDVHKSFKTVRAVRGISLDIHEGQYVALLGPNGAGKTTLVEMIEGIQKPDQGAIRIFGKQWDGNARELHRIIGLTLQETRFIDKLTVLETLKLFAGFYSLDKYRVEEIVELVGLKEKSRSYVVHLSGGQRQRLTLGIALLNYPKILLLDEPTTGLDPNARREIWDILIKLKIETQTSLILTTHYMEEAEKLCDYITIVNNGLVIMEGTREQLLNEQDGEKIVEFSTEKAYDSLDLDSAGFPFKLQWDPENRKGIISLVRVERELPFVLDYFKEKNIELKNLEWRKKTLDDLFISLTGRHLHE